VTYLDATEHQKLRDRLRCITSDAYSHATADEHRQPLESHRETACIPPDVWHGDAMPDPVSAAPSQSEDTPPPGWYKDPWQHAPLRYFDGTAWTGYTSQLPVTGTTTPSTAPRRKLATSTKVIIACAVLVPILIYGLIVALVAITTFQDLIVSNERAKKAVHTTAISIAESANLLAIENGEDTTNRSLAAAVDQTTIPSKVKLLATRGVQAANSDTNGMVVVERGYVACVEIDATTRRARLSSEGPECRAAARAAGARSLSVG